MFDLKPQDLTIGNWYWSIKFNKPVKCTSSDIYNLVAEADGAEIDPSIMFKPLPLSITWINSFGLSKSVDESFGEYQGMSSRVLISLSHEDNGLHWTVSKDILYVHQLQDLFRAQGHELTID